MQQFKKHLNKKNIQYAAISAVSVVVVIACYEFFFKTPPSAPQQAPAPVSVAEVVERKVQLYNEFSGRLEAVDQVEIRPQVGGVIESINFQEGANVNKGDVLFIIDQRPYTAALGKAEAELASAQAQESLAKTDFGRAKKLIEGKAIPQKEFDQRNNNLKLAEANLKTAEAGITIAKLNLEYSLVKAPISGRVGRAEVTVGNLIDAGGKAPLLTTIVSSDPIYADFEIDEQTYLTYIKAHSTGNSKARKISVMMGLAGETGTPHKGEIRSFDNQIERNSGTIRVRAVFDNKDGSLVPGLFVRMRLGSAAKAKVILVTDRAIGTDQSKKFVLVVGGDNKVERRDVRLGQGFEGLRVVEEGLKPGDKIIVNGLQRVRPDSVVAPETVPMEDVPAALGQKAATKPVTDSEEADTEEEDNSADSSFEENNSSYVPGAKNKDTQQKEKADNDFEENDVVSSPAGKTEDIKIKDEKKKGAKKAHEDDTGEDVE